MLRSPIRYIAPAPISPASQTFAEMTSRELGIPRPLGEILHHRGITTLDEAQEFLHPHLSMLPPPDNMMGMAEAVRCLVASCREQRPIYIHGDYDVDGISATALLVSFFRELGYEVHYYIPNRLAERYGLSIDSVNRLVAQGQGRAGVLVSVDCGITAIAEVEHAKALGLRVIITDHHEPQETLPKADAILNPKQNGCSFPCAVLSGVGVAFYLSMALRKAFAASGVAPDAAGVNLKKYLDLVALGTVADVVPLVGVNRILVRAGLEVLSAKSRSGLFFLCQSSGLKTNHLQTEDISFKLAPRINAAGRLGFPRKGVELLLAENSAHAQRLAQELEQMNSERKQLECGSLSLIEALCEEQVRAGFQGLSVYQHDCHPGVLGILASRIVDRFQRPVIVFADEGKNDAGQLLKGSGRSVKGVNLFHALEQCAHVIDQFGGHPMAVGLTVRKDNLPRFSQLFNHQIRLQNNKLPDILEVQVDYHGRDVSILSKQFFSALQWLQPFGEGNPEPVFLLARQTLLFPRVHNGHLIFQVQGRGHVFPGIGFHLACAEHDYRKPVDLVFHLKRSWFKGVEREQVQALHLATA